MSQDDRRADVLRQFQAIIGGAGLDELRQLADGLSRLGVGPGERDGLDAPNCAGSGSENCSASW